MENLTLQQLQELINGGGPDASAAQAELNFRLTFLQNGGDRPTNIPPNP